MRRVWVIGKVKLEQRTGNAEIRRLPPYTIKRCMVGAEILCGWVLQKCVSVIRTGQESKIHSTRLRVARSRLVFSF